MQGTQEDRDTGSWYAKTGGTHGDTQEAPAWAVGVGGCAERQAMPGITV